MIIGCVKEIKNNEFRVGLTPSAAMEYIKNGHSVYLETNAGVGSSFCDAEYEAVGVRILKTAKEVWKKTDMIVKVKEPLKEEYPLMKENQILYTFLHLAADKDLTLELLNRRVTGVAYETIIESDGSLPCLKPMSQVAGRLAALEGAKYLQTPNGGRGLLIGGVTGVDKANCLVIGAGVVGENAINYLVGLSGKVTVLDINLNRLEQLERVYKGTITTLYNSEKNLIESLKQADLIISSVLLPGAKAPKLIKREYYQFMKKGAVIVDVSIDQGGTTEVSRPTTHKDPVFICDGIVHYCVANMPGAVSLTSTQALNNATLKYGLMLANAKNIEDVMKNSKPLRGGLNTYKGLLVNEPVAQAFSLPFSTIV